MLGRHMWQGKGFGVVGKYENVALAHGMVFR